MSSVYLEHRDAFHVAGASSREEIARALDRVAVALLDCDAWMVTAGAGIGVDSGMPDFRGPTGLFHDRETPMTWEETSNDKWFAEDPAFAWGMFYSRLDMYRTTIPHAGFDVLLKWATDLRKPYYIFTSNVDCQFQTAGFPDGRVIACHGDFAYLQCVDRNCKGPNHPEDQVWSADCIPRGLGANGGIDGNYRFADPTALDAPYFHCPRCGKLARPNVWMCKDKNTVLRQSSTKKYDQFHQWKNELQDAKAKVVVFE
jgi:NAD-dependent SIR2 family protein deacetylase